MGKNNKRSKMQALMFYKGMIHSYKSRPSFMGGLEKIIREEYIIP